jgi:hypothetical protein
MLSIEYYETEDGKIPKYQLKFDKLIVDFEPNVSKQDLKDFINFKKSIVYICKKDKSKISIVQPDDEKYLEDSDDEDFAEVNFDSPAFSAFTTLTKEKAYSLCKKLMKINCE